MSTFLRPTQTNVQLSKAELEALEICNYLKGHSDVFCPVMQELLPLTQNQHAHLVLQSMLELGFVITPPNN